MPTAGARRRAALASTILLAAAALLAGAAGLALDLQQSESVLGPPDRASLGAGGLPRMGFSPLRDSFVGQFFGLGTSGGSAVSAAAPGPEGCIGFLCAAVSITRLPYEDQRDTSAAQPSGALTSCAAAPAAAWYRLTPERDELVLARASGYPLVLAAYAGVSPATLEELQCDSEPGGRAALNWFRARAGHSYYFEVAAPARGGLLTFSLSGDQMEVVSAPYTRIAGTGGGANHPSAISGTGRYVAFVSEAPGMAADGGCSANEAGQCTQLFVRDRELATTSAVGPPASGLYQGDEYPITGASLSADGRYVAFASSAQLATGRQPQGPQAPVAGTAGPWNVYLYDRVTRDLEQVAPGHHLSAGDSSCNVWPPGAGLTYCGYVPYPGPGSTNPVISADGRFVAFQSDYYDLYPAQEQSAGQCDPTVHCAEEAYVLDRATGEVELASADAGGPTAYPGATLAGLSADGRQVLYATSGGFYLTNLLSRAWRAVPLPAGYQSPGNPALSADGGHVAFSAMREGSQSSTSDVFEWISASGELVKVASGASDNSLSADGTRVVLAKAGQVYVADLRNGSTTLESVKPDGQPGTGWTVAGPIAADGLSLIFETSAGALTGDATCSSPTLDCSDILWRLS